LIRTSRVRVILCLAISWCGVKGARHAEAAGLVTAAPAWAVRSSPPFDAAGMDGIAVSAADTVRAGEGGYSAREMGRRVR
jgi:molybdopterin biosynthesis enzyme